MESGQFEILVGSSSRDILLRTSVSIRAAPAETPDYRESAPIYYDLAGAEEVPLDQFEALIGTRIPAEAPIKKGEFDLNTTVGDLGITTFGKLFGWAVVRLSTRTLPRDAPESQRRTLRATAMSLPLRSFFAMTGGAMTYEAALGLLDVLNGKTFKGL